MDEGFGREGSLGIAEGLFSSLRAGAMWWVWLRSLDFPREMFLVPMAMSSTVVLGFLDEVDGV